MSQVALLKGIETTKMMKNRALNASKAARVMNVIST
jgi:hypothetical protein